MLELRNEIKKAPVIKNQLNLGGLRNTATAKYLESRYLLTPKDGHLSFSETDQKIIQAKRLEVSKTPYKVNDLLMSIEKGDTLRVKAHIDEKTPLNEKTFVNRILTESWDAVEYSVLCKRYDVFKLLKASGAEVSERVVNEARNDRFLARALGN